MTCTVHWPAVGAGKLSIGDAVNVAATLEPATLAFGQITSTTVSSSLNLKVTNVSGSGCSLGHPVAATGARMIITTMYELRRRGGGIGLASMCAGGGMGSTTVFEVLAG